MSQPPTRPFESLSWYHDAARHGFRDERGNTWSRWARGSGMLRAHVSMFAIGMVLLYGVNLSFDPASSWSRWLIVAWAMLLGIHVIAVSLLWALGQWYADDPDEPLIMPTQSIPGSWGMAPDQSNVQDADFRVTDPEPASSRQSLWNPWRSVEPEPEIAPEDRASWSEASPSAWLTRSEVPDERVKSTGPSDR